MNVEQRIPKANMRTEMRRWLKTLDWNVAATFTFADEVSERTAQKIMRKFWVLVDDRLYGNEAKRRKRRCNRINVIEGGANGKRIHLARHQRGIVVDEAVIATRFGEEIRHIACAACQQSTPWLARHVHLQLRVKENLQPTRA